MLYELLTGETPFDKQRLRSAAFDEMLRIIREEEPPRPSTRVSTSDSLAFHRRQSPCRSAKLTSLVRGELDWIVMKAWKRTARDVMRRPMPSPTTCSTIWTTNRSRPARLQLHTDCANSSAKQSCPGHSYGRWRLALVLGILGTSWQAVRAINEAERANAAEQLALRRYEETENARRLEVEHRSWLNRKVPAPTMRQSRPSKRRRLPKPFTNF